MDEAESNGAGPDDCKNGPPVAHIITDPAVALEPSAMSKKTRDLTDHALTFLSTATPEVLGATAVGLCATSYLVLGRVGLLLIGIGAGVVLHASWDSSNEDGRGEETRKRRELGTAVAKRVLDWRETKINGDIRQDDGAVDVDVMLSSQKPLNFSEFKPATGAALTTLTDSIIRDYVKWWYGPILPSELAFPTACRQTLTAFILSFSSHLSRKRPADTFLEFLTNSSSIIIVFLNELAGAMMTPSGLASTPAEAVHKYLQDEPESNLANVLSVKQQQKKLNLVADDILQTFLDPKAYNFNPAKVFLREILAGVVLEMTVINCSRPEWINEWIVYLLEEGEPKLMNAIDAGVGGKSSDEVKVAIDDEVGLVQRSASTKRDGHRRRVSKAEEAMEQAMLEAKRMSDMIAAEDEKRREESMHESSENGDAISTSTTEGIATPTSLDSDRNRAAEGIAESTVANADQIMPSGVYPATPEPLMSPRMPLATPALTLTLHNATVSIFDDAVPDGKGTIRGKPTAEYLLQIEPASSRNPGWMIARKYTDFETLHEVLRRISVVSGVSRFTDRHATLPTWKGQTKPYLRQNLERYLQDSLKYERLAESEGMKRFLEKDQGLGRAPSTNSSKPAFAAFETVSKGVLDVLASAPKGVAGSGKTVLGGVTGVFGAVGVGGQRKVASPGSPQSARGTPTRALSANKASIPSPPRDSRDGGLPSTEDLTKPPPLPQRPSATVERPTSPSESDRSEPSDDKLGRPPAIRTASAQQREELHLPPPPSAIDDDYAAPDSPTPSKSNTELIPDRDDVSHHKILAGKSNPPITEEETHVAVELLFAVINELYILSSAWNIRRTLLGAAKAFLLRPGNPNLEAIRQLLQDSVIEANTTDSGLATHILKLRENTLPTEDELKAWPPPKSEDEKEKLRVKARKLLVTRGMPQALMSVMGAAASGEALGRVFDCLQVEQVARGLIFALLLQAIRAATQ